MTAPTVEAPFVPSSPPVRVLLVNPRVPESFWSFRWAVTRVLPGKRTLNPPLGLATLAALCPKSWDVRIVDENVETLPTSAHADIVGVCGMAVQFNRQLEILTHYRRQGCRVVAGGSYASLCPERYEGLADTVVAGEAEYIWPQFCSDYESGAPQRLYRETGTVDLADSPVPRFELLKLDRYSTISLQFSRGCPYRCEFCDIIVMFGRRPRTKRPEQIGRELDRLRAFGIRNAFFVDDNLIGHKRKAKELLRYLAEYQRRYGYRFQFGTEASLNLAEDNELPELFRAANFAWVFIGIESPDPNTLRQTGKTQNVRQDILTAIRRLYRHGIDVFGGFIVGFDTDTPGCFACQRGFIGRAGIQVAMVGLLTALPKTPLYERLAKVGRLRPGGRDGDNTCAYTNITPKRMSYDELVQGYRKLYADLLNDAGIASRIREKTRFLRRPVYAGGYSVTQSIGILVRLVTRGILPGGPSRWVRFASTLAGSTPRAWPLVINDWIAGLSLRDFAGRHLFVDYAGERRLITERLSRIRERFAGSFSGGALEMSLAPQGTDFVVTLRGAVAPEFFSVAGRRLGNILRQTSARLTLRVDHLANEQLAHLQRMLRRLARHGDRVQIRPPATLETVPALDCSAFHLLLDGKR